MKKAIRFFLFFMLANAGCLIGRTIRVYSDFKANPLKYAPPYETWQQELKFDFIIYGSAIVICVIALIVLKALIKKRSQQE